MKQYYQVHTNRNKAVYIFLAIAALISFVWIFNFTFNTSVVEAPLVELDENTGIRFGMDFGNITRDWEISGVIQASSLVGFDSAGKDLGSTKATVMAVRDRLINMVRGGGQVLFSYGINSDVTGSGYTYNSRNGYFGKDKFKVYIRRLMITENPKGGAIEGYTGNSITAAPEDLEVNISLQHTEAFN